MKTFYKTMKIAATVALFCDGSYYSCVQPGPMDFANATVLALVIYAIWFARERTQ